MQGVVARVRAAQGDGADVDSLARAHVLGVKAGALAECHRVGADDVGRAARHARSSQAVVDLVGARVARRERLGRHPGASGVQPITVKGVDSIEATNDARHRNSDLGDPLVDAYIFVNEIAGPQRKSCARQNVPIKHTGGRCDAGTRQINGRLTVVNLGDRTRQGGRQYGWR